MSQPFPFSGEMITPSRTCFNNGANRPSPAPIFFVGILPGFQHELDKTVRDGCVTPSCFALTGLHHEWAILRAIQCSRMGVTIELQNLGDVRLCRDITAHVEHAFADRRGDWRGIRCRVTRERELGSASRGTERL